MGVRLFQHSISLLFQPFFPPLLPWTSLSSYQTPYGFQSMPCVLMPCSFHTCPSSSTPSFPFSLEDPSLLIQAICCQLLWWYLAPPGRCLVASSLIFSYSTSAAASRELIFFSGQILDFSRAGLSLVISVSWVCGMGLAYMLSSWILQLSC